MRSSARVPAYILPALPKGVRTASTSTTLLTELDVAELAARSDMDRPS